MTFRTNLPNAHRCLTAGKASRQMNTGVQDMDLQASAVQRTSLLKLPRRLTASGYFFVWGHHG